MADAYQVGDIDMHTLVRGSGVPLVLLHAFPLNHTMWNTQIEALAARCRVIAPDQRGFGETPLGQKALTIEQLADDVAAPQISVPALAIVGEQDVLTPVDAMNTMAAGIPNCQRHIIPDCGHLSAMERPIEFNAALLEFLSRPGVLA